MTKNTNMTFLDCDRDIETFLAPVTDKACRACDAKDGTVCGCCERIKSSHVGTALEDSGWGEAGW